MSNKWHVTNLIWFTREEAYVKTEVKNYAKCNNLAMTGLTVLKDILPRSNKTLQKKLWRKQVCHPPLFTILKRLLRCVRCLIVKQSMTKIEKIHQKKIITSTWLMLLKTVYSQNFAGYPRKYSNYVNNYWTIVAYFSIKSLK